MGFAICGSSYQFVIVCCIDTVSRVLRPGLHIYKFTNTTIYKGDMDGSIRHRTKKVRRCTIGVGRHNMGVATNGRVFPVITIGLQILYRYNLGSFKNRVCYSIYFLVFTLTYKVVKRNLFFNTPFGVLCVGFGPYGVTGYRLICLSVCQFRCGLLL